MVGYRRQKLFVLTAAVAAAVLIVLYFYSLRKTSDAFKPLTLVFASSRTHTVTGLQIVKDKKRRYQGYDNAVQFDHVSIAKCLFMLHQFWISFCFCRFRGSGEVNMFLSLEFLIL